MTRALLVAAVLFSASAAESEEMRVTIVKPLASQVVYGDVEVVAEPGGSEAVARVEFLVDGRAVGTVARPPYRIVVDVGQDNVEHVFRVVARGATGHQASATVTTQKIEVNEEVRLRLQQVYVTVTANTSPLGDLQREEFVIHDEGKRQQLVTFARGEIPFTAVLLVDASTSMEGGKLESAIRGAKAFAQRMQPLDETKLIVFSDQIRASSPFTSFPEVLTAGLERVRAVGGTAINDVLYLALSRLEERQGRRVVVLLSDGLDSHSALDMGHVMPGARRCRAITFWIRTRSGDDATSPNNAPAILSPWRDQKNHREEFERLRDLVVESGGRIVEVSTPEDIESAFRDIVGELRSHYVLGYYPSVQRGPGHWHTIRVEVTRRGAAARTSMGYVE